MKIDIPKAYDSVHWAFLEEMMKLLNFPSHFISMIMEFVSSPKLSLMLNESTVYIVVIWLQEGFETRRPYLSSSLCD